jgi:hypothetical protein
LRQTRFFFPRKFSYGLKMFFLMNYDWSFHSHLCVHTVLSCTS